MAAPYGMAYGIGEMFSKAVPAYQQGIQMGMQNRAAELALQEKEQSIRDRQMLNQIASTPLGYEEEQMMKSIPDTPYHKQAAQFSIYAQRARKAGMGTLAMDMDRKAQEQASLGEGYIYQNIGRALSTGNKDMAKSMMNSLGANAVSIEEIPPSPEMPNGGFVIQHADGTMTPVGMEQVHIAGLGPKEGAQIGARLYAQRLANVGGIQKIQTRGEEQRKTQQMKSEFELLWRREKNATDLEREAMRQKGKMMVASMVQGTARERIERMSNPKWETYKVLLSAKLRAGEDPSIAARDTLFEVEESASAGQGKSPADRSANALTRWQTAYLTSTGDNPSQLDVATAKAGFDAMFGVGGSRNPVKKGEPSEQVQPPKKKNLPPPKTKSVDAELQALLGGKK